MPEFRTVCEIPPYPFKPWDYPTRFLAAGSCFASSIGQKLLAGGHNGAINPLGVVFNPVSLVNGLLATPENLLTDAVKAPQGWVSYHAHSTIYGATLQELKAKLVQCCTNRDQQLAEADVILLTLGTAWAWQLVASGKTVANCQKQPGQLFSKALLDLATIHSALCNLVRAVGDKPIVLTVSPVRHTKEGLVGNQLSKSLLRLAVQELVEAFPNQCYYFPAYEMVVDDLRDYRFYEADMIHPSQVAVDYIWQAFKQTTMSSSAQEHTRIAEQAWRRAQHRPIIKVD